MNSFIHVSFLLVIGFCCCVDFARAAEGDLVLGNLGCWRENTAIPSAVDVLGENYKQRVNAIQDCAKFAADRGYDVFGIQDNGKCVTSSNARSLYQSKGRSNDCPPHGRGAPWVNEVYEIKRVFSFTLKHLGCWKENTAIPNVESFLSGNYQDRTDALLVCSLYASMKGYRVFALQDNGKCVTSENAINLYNAKQRAYNCPAHGRGTAWVNQVYEISKLQQIVLKDLGCWNENVNIPNAMQELGTQYQQRDDAVQLCANYASFQGFKVFGVQDNGKCVTSSDAENLYEAKYRAYSCPSHGKGAPWVNQVYEIY